MQSIALENVFTYHAPDGQPMIDTYQKMREGGLTLAKLIDEVVPDGAEKTLAICKVREAVMWANAGIACS